MHTEDAPKVLGLLHSTQLVIAGAPFRHIRDKCLILIGERGRNRTYNLLIKSHLLCQLSYAPARENS